MNTKANILLIILDSLRARNTDIYGYDRRTTPFLREYSNHATIYKQARSAGIHSVASHASMWTGQPVAEHEAYNHNSSISINKTVWRELSDAGYQTGLFTGNAVISWTSNLSAPFDYVVTDYWNTGQKLFEEAYYPPESSGRLGWLDNFRMCITNEYPLKSLANSTKYLTLKQRNDFSKNLNSRQYIKFFFEWRQRIGEPWAACINLMDTHFPYEPAAEHDQWDDGSARSIQKSTRRPMSEDFVSNGELSKLAQLQNLYDGAIHEADAHVRRLIRKLKKINEHDDTLIIITSDHGEGFGEKSLITNAKMVDHSWGVHEVLTHVPLVVKYPGQIKGHEIIEPVSLTAFAETARSVANGNINNNSFVQNKNVVVSTKRLLRKDEHIFETSDENPADYLGPWRAVYRFKDNVVRKYIDHANGSAIIEIPSSQEHIFRQAYDHGVVDEAFDKFERNQNEEKAHNSGEISEEMKQRLSELGYLT